MRIDILTLFPLMFNGPFDESIIKRAKDKGFAKINIHDLRKWTSDKHQTVDDRPFGGGVGMVLKVDVIHKAVNALKSEIRNTKSEIKSKVILLDAGGEKFTQEKASDLSLVDHLILICGHYEGVDNRVHEHIADEIISIGDYVLTGGEIPAMVLTDTIVRLIPGVLVKEDAAKFESFSEHLSLPTTNNLQPTTLLEYPHYTRPLKFLGWEVPKILTSGNHKEIDKWRQEQSIVKTKKVRPDLIKK